MMDTTELAIAIIFTAQRAGLAEMMGLPSNATSESIKERLEWVRLMREGELRPEPTPRTYPTP